MSTDNDHESTHVWSSLIQSLADSDLKDNLYPEISSPMSTSMSIGVPPEPGNALLDKDKEARLGKAVAEDGDKNINEGGQKSIAKEIDEEKQEGAKEQIKSVGKRPRSTESRNMAEKRRRTDIRTKIEDLKQLTPNCEKRDIASTLDCIIDHIRSMKLYVERQSVGPMLPLGMRMDFPAPWFVRCPHFLPPNLIMPFRNFISGETITSDQQIVPFTKGFINQPQSSKSM